MKRMWRDAEKWIKWMDEGKPEAPQQNGLKKQKIVLIFIKNSEKVVI